MLTKSRILFLLLLLLAIVLRSYHLDWDQGYQIHPDEKIIFISALPLHSVHTLAQFLSPDSPLNPKFFIYGSFPLYTIKFLSIIVSFFYHTLSEEQVYILGRMFSVGFDVGTLITLYYIGKQLLNKTFGMLVAFLYTCSVLPIQASHFYTVDGIVTFFITLTLYMLLLFYEKRTIWKALLIGVFAGLALSTKYTAVLLVLPVAVLLFLPCFTFSIKKRSVTATVFFKPLFYAMVYGIAIASLAAGTFILWNPYAFLDSSQFWQQLVLPSRMTHDPFTYPFTLQFVGMIRYWYESKNIFLWGEGPVLGTLSFSGIGVLCISLWKRKEVQATKWLPFMLFFWIYFLVVGSFAVGFIRYMLPVYPLLALFGGYVVREMYRAIVKNYPRVRKVSLGIFIVAVLLYPLSFVHIYTKPHTLIQASDWIVKHIPPGKTIMTEVGDIQLPLYDKEKYTNITITPYDPDTPQKQGQVKQALERADYLILASGRSYIPLPKLTDCKKLPLDSCYPFMAKYYRNLFDGSLGFKKIAEFTDYPQVPFTHLAINDDSADETFIVFDHPKVMIFKKYEKNQK